MVWDRDNLSERQWTNLADQLGEQLNATWYMETCVFLMASMECPATNRTFWVVETIFFGLLVFMSIGNKRKPRCTKEPRS